MCNEEHPTETCPVGCVYRECVTNSMGLLNCAPPAFVPNELWYNE